MPVIDRIKDFQNDLVAIRRDIHAHPEIGFEETRTSAIVADLLETWGITVHRGVGGTGVVGELRGNHNSNKRIGLRADMDALPILETTGLPYASTVPGKMHEDSRYRKECPASGQPWPRTVSARCQASRLASCAR